MDGWILAPLLPESLCFFTIVFFLQYMLMYNSCEIDVTAWHFSDWMLAFFVQIQCRWYSVCCQGTLRQVTCARPCHAGSNSALCGHNQRQCYTMQASVILRQTSALNVWMLQYKMIVCPGAVYIYSSDDSQQREIQGLAGWLGQKDPTGLMLTVTL